MSILIDIPHTLAQCILIAWLGFRDLAVVDSAFCQHEKRSGLLSLFTSPEFILPGNEKSDGDCDFLKWLCS